jgi:predicted metal-dependent HD superfamily phosphohydrolase
LESLKLRWENLLLKFGIEQQTARPLYADLSNLYSRPDRHYHTLDHIQHFLAVVDALSAKAKNLEAIEFAALFHDVIYDAKAKDNEEKSAEYAESILNNLDLPREVIDKVTRLILKTKTHQITEDNDIDTKIMLDADLAILGAKDDAYRRYAQAIRLEYAWVKDKDYCYGRTQFLQSLLKRQKIYQLEEMFEKLETKARQNIQQEIDAVTVLD